MSGTKLVAREPRSDSAEVASDPAQDDPSKQPRGAEPGPAPPATETKQVDETASQTPPTPDDTKAALLGGLMASGVAVWIVLANDASRSWIYANWMWFTPIVGVVVLVTVTALIGFWAKSRSSSLRASVYLLALISAIAVGTASIFLLPTSAQLVALRVLALCVLVITPAMMWWLFIATQRASLLNEFIANLDRFGLLADATETGGESESARETRISSYLQKFEATYGGLQEQIRSDVVRGEFRSYSTMEARSQTSLISAAAPVTLATVTLLIGWILVLPPVDTFPATQVSPRWLLALAPNATPVTFAFLGAYFFAMQMLFRRYVRGDLRGSAYVAVALRVVLAVVGIWVVEGAGRIAGWTSEGQLLVIAFVVGVFPVVVWQVLSAVAGRLLNIVLPTLHSPEPLNTLDGLTIWHEARLEEEDVENVQNMATVDIVDLMINTRIPISRLIDWIDQAILLNQLGPVNGTDQALVDRQQLANCGIRSASALLQAAASSDQRQVAVLEELMVVNGRSTLPVLITCLGTSDNLRYVMRWRGLPAV